MSRANVKKHSRGQKKAVALVFGEDANDREAIAVLVKALKPEFKGNVEPIRDPLVLIKNARLENVPSRAQKLIAAIRANAAVNDVQAVFLHEDADAIEPAHIGAAQKIESAMSKEGWPAHAVVPAWDIEAWWFQWPEAVAAVRPNSWRAPVEYVGKNVGKLPNTKKLLKHKTVPTGLTPQKRNRFPEYQESDSPLIAKKVMDLGLARKPQAKSDSYSRFVKSVDKAL